MIAYILQIFIELFPYGSLQVSLAFESGSIALAYLLIFAQLCRFSKNSLIQNILVALFCMFRCFSQFAPVIEACIQIPIRSLKFIGVLLVKLEDILDKLFVLW